MAKVLFKSAEGAVRFYIILYEETLRFVPALYPGEKVYLPKKIACPKCGNRGYRWSESKRKGARWICASSHCGRTWPTHPVVDSVLVQRFGKPPMEDFRDLYCDLGRIFHRLFLWERRVLFAYVWLERRRLPNGARRVEVVTYALRRRHAYVVQPWTAYRVRQLLKSARLKVEQALDVAHLLAAG